MDDSSTATDYTANVGRIDGETYSIAWDQLVELVTHANRLGASRLDLLKSLQTALPSQDTGDLADLKELLSNLIIMQTRLAGREKELNESLTALSVNPPVSHVTSNQDTISSVANEILSAAQRIRSKV